MKIIFTKTFERSYKKFIRNYPEEKSKIQKIIALLENNYLDTRLLTHKLTGKLKGLYSASCGFNCRLIFSIEESNENGLVILLIDIGTHDEVY